MRSVLLMLLLALAAAAPALQADERILRYHSDITIREDGSMLVEETIDVRAEGNRFRRGLYRDFPTDYEDRLGNAYRVAFRVVSVRRNGQLEDWHTERLSNGVRVYAGSSDRLLPPGEHSYLIRYETDRQLGFFEAHDELYWNVTGNGWDFAMDAVSAAVSLPRNLRADEVTIEGYTGVYGSRGQDYEAAFEGGRAVIRGTRPLAPREGLSVVVGFPKGIVPEPTSTDRLLWLLTDNRGLLIAIGALLLAFGWLFFCWHRVGRDPEAGVIFAHYEPPDGYSPASMRYVRGMRYDPGTFSAAVVNMAVKGHLKIHKRGKDYSLTSERSDKPLAPGEAALLGRLFGSGSRLELDNENHGILQAARSAHRSALRRDYLGRYFKKNSALLLPSAAGSVLAFVLVLMLGAVTPLAVFVFVLNAGVHGLFAYLLKAPTTRGRELLDKLEGFRLYLDVAEKDDLNIAHPPEKTPELFERYLPFAIALGVEQTWAEQFTQVFARISAEQGQSYRPGWYVGDFSSARLGGFSKDIGSSFTSAISSAASPPGSSSGGGGGGFSGGGGGGGGGGGW